MAGGAPVPFQPAFVADAEVHRALARELRQAGDEFGALAHLIAVRALESRGGPEAAASLAALADVATGYFMLERDAPAERWYRLLLALAPDSAMALQNLGALCLRNQRSAEGLAFKQQAYALQRVFIERVPGARRRVLLLCTGLAAGNVPFEGLLSAGLSDRIKYAIDCAKPEEDAALPSFDLVFNALGDADAAAPCQDRLERFADSCLQPVLNRPEAVAQTRRDRLAGRLHGVPGLVCPACLRLEGPEALTTAVASVGGAGGPDWPVLLRPAGTHGGEGLWRCEGKTELVRAVQAMDGAFYLSQYQDYRSADGHFRKYRMVFVDGQPWPYHLAIGEHWLLHYFSADMLAQDWKRDEERRFLDNPAAVLGASAMAALRTLGERLGLDYAGVDFSLLPDGRLLVFEANATMLVHRERGEGPLAHKNAAVQHIYEAFEAMLRRRLEPSRGR